MVPDSRACTKCRLDKPLSEFSKAPRGKYGRKASCKACDAARFQADYVPAVPDEQARRKRYTGRQDGPKTCNRCHVARDRTEFHSGHEGKYGPVLKSICKPCHAAATREWYSRNSDQSNTNRRRLQLKKDYNLTPEQYEAMVVAQNGVCAICKRPERTKRNGKVMRMSVDHCRETGLIRALLCHSCNRALGLLGDSVEHMRKAIEYLLLHRAKAVE
jgi:hypothetical protein